MLLIQVACLIAKADRQNLYETITTRYKTKAFRTKGMRGDAHL
jgi:hypothetical protein